MRRWFVNLPDQDLAYLPGDGALRRVRRGRALAQEFARINRELMMTRYRRHPRDRQAAGVRGTSRGGELPPQLRGP
jgi:hypothetical protein